MELLNPYIRTQKYLAKISYIYFLNKQIPVENA